jgi:hypothetical protein
MPTEDENENGIINVVKEKKEHSLQKFIKEKCPNISKMKQQLTYDEAERLFADFTPQELQSVIEAMENYKLLTTKSISVNLTIRNWIRRDKKNGTGTSERRRKDYVTDSEYSAGLKKLFEG